MGGGAINCSPKPLFRQTSFPYSDQEGHAGEIMGGAGVVTRLPTRALT